MVNMTKIETKVEELLKNILIENEISISYPTRHKNVIADALTEAVHYGISLENERIRGEIQREIDRTQGFFIRNNLQHILSLLDKSVKE